MLVDEYVASLTGVRARRLGEFRRRVLGPWRAVVGKRVSAGRRRAAASRGLRRATSTSTA